MSSSSVAFVEVREARQAVTDSATTVDREPESTMVGLPPRVSPTLPTLLLSKEARIMSRVKLQSAQRTLPSNLSSASRDVPLKLPLSFAPPPGLPSLLIDLSEEVLPMSKTMSDSSTEAPSDTHDTSSENADEQDEVGYIPGRALRFAINQPTQVLNLSNEIIDEPHACGFPGCPSVGSIHHHSGLCVPCDFIHRGDSCRMGAACKFCHLCGPDALKEKKKQRARAVKLARKWKFALGENVCGA